MRGPLGFLLALVACSAFGAEPGPSLARIRDTGVIVAGYRPSSPPFSYLDARLKPIGYSVSLCERIIGALKAELRMPGLETKWVEVTSATRMPLVANGALDLECGITTHNAERARSQGFSLTIFVAQTRLLSRRSEPVQRLADLRGKPVVSTIGTTSIQHLHEVNEREGLELHILAGLDDPESFRTLQAGRAAAYMMDDVLLRSLQMQQARPDDYLISTEALTVEPYGLGLNRDDPGFKRMVDGVLRNLFRSGEIREIYRQWFESPIPPRGINLGMPMSAAFKRLTLQPTDSADPARYR
ncbi:amino acid ABC transporter substrate-binding protein [Pelomonas sp. KK5]|uniref:amino acid ABC transporter substrate-binding protein n=1 Tax=Pelomonas sp. KK5 TaxID=1855730 RepID=UPI00097BCC80|nr:amino acid ABC transporter substrate-binding protein [Pelomonas sp. KK5]